MVDRSEQMTQLKVREAKLTNKLTDIVDRLDDEPSKDWEGRATEMQGDEVLETMGARDLSELRQSTQRLPVSQTAPMAERLRSVSATPFCVACAR